MSTFIEIFQGLPIILLISVLFGGIALIRIYLMNSSSIRRVTTQDRRQSLSIVSYPYNDANNNIISEDRRKLINRRLASHVIVNYCVIR